MTRPKSQEVEDSPDLKAAHEAIEELELQCEDLEARLAKQAEEHEAQLEDQREEIEGLMEQLLEAKQFTHLPFAVSMERTGSRTKLFDENTGLQIQGYKKAKTELSDGKGASVTITFEADLTNVEFKKPQLSLLDEPEGEGGEGEEGEPAETEPQTAVEEGQAPEAGLETPTLHAVN